jgi:nucleoside-diphosphate-sugar epimerase
MQLPDASERLQLVQADLLTPGAFDSVVQGCDGVIHTASPVIPYSENVDSQTQLLVPAVKGTINVLESCAKAKGVKRVVLTSSRGSVAYTPHRASGAVLDESSWSDVDSNRENQVSFIAPPCSLSNNGRQLPSIFIKLMSRLKKLPGLILLFSLLTP